MAPIVYDYAGVDAAGGTFQSMVSRGITNAENMSSEAVGLFSVVSGQAMTDSSDVVTRFNNKVSAFVQATKELRDAVQAAAGAGGDMNQTDVHQGKRFMSINIR